MDSIDRPTPDRVDDTRHGEETIATARMTANQPKAWRDGLNQVAIAPGADGHQPFRLAILELSEEKRRRLHREVRRERREGGADRKTLPLEPRVHLTQRLSSPQLDVTWPDCRFLDGRRARLER